VDLVLVDWDLGNGARGQDAILEIRDNVSTGLKRPHFHRVCCWEEEAIGKDAVRTL
jgi:hypothetical protein